MLESPSQFVIYGANGWMGRSAVEFLSLIDPEIAEERLLLIGSRSSELLLNGRTFKILDPTSGFSSIQENSVFLNSVFLRREALITVPAEEYVRKNREISTFAMKILKEKKLFSFIKDTLSFMKKVYTKLCKQMASIKIKNIKALIVRRLSRLFFVKIYYLNHQTYFQRMLLWH